MLTGLFADPAVADICLDNELTRIHLIFWGFPPNSSPPAPASAHLYQKVFDFSTKSLLKEIALANRPSLNAVLRAQPGSSAF